MRHYANAWQEGCEIVTVFPWRIHLGFAASGRPPPRGHVVRARIDPAAGRLSLETLDERATEFPRIDDRRQGRNTRYAMVSHRVSPTLRGGSFDELLRFDLARGTTMAHRFTGQAIGEAVFAPKAGRSEEGAGYVLTFHRPYDDGIELHHPRHRRFLRRAGGCGEAAAAHTARAARELVSCGILRN